MLEASFADDESKITTFLQGDLEPKVSVEYFKPNQQSLEYSIAAPQTKSPMKSVKSKLASQKITLRSKPQEVIEQSDSESQSKPSDRFKEIKEARLK